jgi:methyl-accepting chemotaxis protein
VAGSDEVDRLYAVPLDRFVDERAALARRLREAGEREEARRVSRLRKPPFGVWVANRLAREHEKEMHALAQAAERLAQGEAAADESFRAALGALVAAAPDVVEEAGRQPTDANLQPVLAMLRAAAADAESRAALVAGRLTEAPRASGFEAMKGAAAGKPRARSATPSGARERTRRVETAREALTEARARARDLGRRASDAEREARRLRKEAERADAAVEEAENQLARARRK